MYRALAWLSETIHERRYGYRMHLCARAAWREEAFWRLWRWVFDRLMLWKEPDHCRRVLWRSME